MMYTQSHRRTRGRAETRGGFTIVEVAVSIALFGMIMGLAAMVGRSGKSAFVSTRCDSEVEAKIHVALDRIAVELLTVSRFSLQPELTGMANDTSDLSMQQVIGVQNGSAVFGNVMTIRYEDALGEPVDGLDNDGDGLVDEGRVVLIRDTGMTSQSRVTLCTNVRRHLEGEFPWGGDENGNGLTDELGFLIQRVDDTLTLQLTVEEITPDGRSLIRTAETSLRLRN